MKCTTYFHHLFFIVFVIVSYKTRADEAEGNEEFSYKAGSKNGPEHWGEIRPEWKDCKFGKMQSPINLVDQTTQVVSNTGVFNTSYKASKATLKHDGHNIMLRWPLGAGNIEINGVRYQLNQIHWHSPSEHTINKKKLDMEAHLVHQTKDKRTAVIGILYKIGLVDPLLSQIKRDLEIVNGKKNVEKEVGDIDPKIAVFGIDNYYRYMGSFTTPPCTQNVIWTIVRKVKTVSQEQVKLIRDASNNELGGNARPVQELSNRVVQRYQPQ